MNRDYSDSDDEYANHRRRPTSVRGSGWQSPLPTSTATKTSSSSSSSVTRIVVESPFGSKKCDYSIDKSQRGKLIITARRRPTSSSEYRSSNQKNHIAIQTFTIPNDADVDRLQSHVEHDTNRLIIEIPRQQRSSSRSQHRSSYINTTNANSRLLRSPDVEQMLTSPTGGPQLIRDDTKSNNRNSGNKRKLEYRIDCRGYTADELEVFIQGRDLIVQGKTRTSSISPDPTQQRVSKKFSRKITLPNTVDLTKVVSYLEHGELRIEAPLKRGVYYSDEEIILPGPPPPSTTNRTAATLRKNLENRTRSPSPPPHRSHYRRNERFSRRRDYDRSNARRVSSPTRRVRSVDSHRHSLYSPSRDIDEDDDEDDDNTKERNSRRQRTTNYERNSITPKQTERPRSLYSPTTIVTNAATTSTINRHHDYPPSDDDNNLRF